MSAKDKAWQAEAVEWQRVKAATALIGWGVNESVERAVVRACRAWGRAYAAAHVAEALADPLALMERLVRDGDRQVYLADLPQGLLVPQWVLWIERIGQEAFKYQTVNADADMIDITRDEAVALLAVGERSEG